MFTLPTLHYGYDALEPFIDRETMHLHHDKHHQAYIDKLNAALENHKDLQEKDIKDLLLGIGKVPEDIKQAVINHGGGHFNHSLFWEIMSPNPKRESREPQGSVREGIEKAWGGFGKFRDDFSESATKLFGSGWTWLGAKPDGSEFHIHNMANQENPLLHGDIPVLGLDVWEHAYYLKYKNVRVDYIKAWWNVVDWNKVEENFKVSK